MYRAKNKEKEKYIAETERIGKRKHNEQAPASDEKPLLNGTCELIDRDKRYHRKNPHQYEKQTLTM